MNAFQELSRTTRLKVWLLLSECRTSWIPTRSGTPPTLSSPDGSAASTSPGGSGSQVKHLKLKKRMDFETFFQLTISCLALRFGLSFLRNRVRICTMVKVSHLCPIRYKVNPYETGPEMAFL